MSWSTGWKSSKKDKDQSKVRYSIFRAGPKNPSLIPKSNSPADPKNSFPYELNSNLSTSPSSHASESTGNNSKDAFPDQVSPFGLSSPTSPFEITNFDFSQISSNSATTKEGFLSKRSDLLYGSSFGSSLGRSWKIYKVILKGAKLFFYKPPSENALKAIFVEEADNQYASPDATKFGMPLRPSEINSDTRPLLFQPVVNDGVIQKPLSERYIYGECFSEISISTLKFKRYVCLLIFDDKLVILKRKWTKGSRASNFFSAFSNKIKIGKKVSSPEIKDSASVANSEISTKGKGHYSKWKVHTFCRITEVDVANGDALDSKNSIYYSGFKSINSSRSSLYSISSQSVSSITTQSSIVSKDFSGMISSGVAPSIQLTFQNDSSLPKMFVAPNMEIKNTWLAKLVVAKASYTQLAREALREKAQKTNIWNKGSNLLPSNINERSSSRNINLPYLNFVPKAESSLPLPLNQPKNATSFQKSSELLENQRSDSDLISKSLHKSSDLFSAPFNGLSDESKPFKSTSLHPDLLILDNEIVSGTPESLVHEAIFQNVSKTSSSVDFTLLLSCIYSQFISTETFLFFVQSFSKLISNPTEPSHQQFVLNICKIIAHFLKNNTAKYSSISINSIEHILLNVIEPSNQKMYNLLDMKTSLEFIKQLNSLQSENSSFSDPPPQITLPQSLDQYSIPKRFKVHNFNSIKTYIDQLTKDEQPKDGSELQPVPDLFSLYLTGLSSNTLLQINPKGLAIQMYLFHGSVSIYLNSDLIKSCILPIKFSPCDNSVNPESLESSNKDNDSSINENSAGDDPNIFFNSTITQSSFYDQLSNEFSVVSTKILSRTIFFTTKEPHFITKLINYHLFVEIAPTQSAKRSDVLLHWIMVGEASRQLGDSVMWAAVALAVTSPQVIRLRETWVRIPLNWKTIVVMEWVPIIIKHNLFSFSTQPLLSDLECLYPLVVGNKKETGVPSIPYYGSIKNNIQKMSEMKQEIVAEKLLSNNNGACPDIFKYCQMLELAQVAFSRLQEFEKDDPDNVKHLKSVLEYSDSPREDASSTRVRSKSVPSALKVEEESVFKSFVLGNNEQINPDMFNIPVEAVPSSQLYFKSLAASPMLFSNKSGTDLDNDYDLKHFLALSLQREPSINDYYQEMLNTDLIGIEAEKSGYSVRYSSVRSQRSLIHTNIEILPLVCPEIVLSTNVLQWVSYSNRRNSSVKKKASVKKRYRSEAPQKTDFIKNTHPIGKEFPQLLEFETEMELKKKSEEMSPSVKTNFLLPLRNGDDNLTLPNQNFAAKRATMVVSPKYEGFNEDAGEHNINSTAHILNSRSNTRRQSVPPKVNINLDSLDFSKLSIRDTDSKGTSSYGSSVDLTKTLAMYIDSVIYASNSDTSFRVLKIKYASPDMSSAFYNGDESRRSSMSNKRNSSFSSSNDVAFTSGDLFQKPIGFLVQVESATIDELLSICINGLDKIEFVTEEHRSTEPILASNGLEPKLFINHILFLRTFLATYRYACLDIDIINYITVNCFGSDSSSPINIQFDTLSRIFELLYQWVQLYPEDFIDNPALFSDLFSLFRKLHSYLTSSKPYPTNKDSSDKPLGTISITNPKNSFLNNTLSEKILDRDNKLALAVSNSSDLQGQTSDILTGNCSGYLDIESTKTLLSMLEYLTHLLLSSVLTPAGFSISEKNFNESIDLAKKMDFQLAEKKQLSMYLLSSPKIDISVDLYSNIHLGEPSTFLLGNLSPIEVLSCLNRLVQTFYSKCTLQDWHTSICLLETQTRVPLSWYSKNKIPNQSDDEVIISDVFRVLSSAVRPTGSLNPSKSISSNNANKYLSSIGLSFKSGFSNKPVFNESSRDENLINLFPNSLKTLFEIHNAIRTWTIQQITDISISPGERVHRICLFIYIIHLCRTMEDKTSSQIFDEAMYTQLYSLTSFSQIIQNYSHNNVINNSGNGNSSSSNINGAGGRKKGELSRDSRNSISRLARASRRFISTSSQSKIDRRLSIVSINNNSQKYVPSFVERAIASALVSPESRMFSRAWNHIAVSHHVSLSTLELMLKGVKDWSFDRWFRSPYGLVSGESIQSTPENSDISKNSAYQEDFFVPCIGWLLENFISLCYDSPDFVGPSDNIINFSKRQNISIVLGICSYLSDRCTDLASLPVVQRINLEYFLQQVSKNNVNIRTMKQLASEENNIPLYSKPKWAETNAGSQELVLPISPGINGQLIANSNNKSWTLNNRQRGKQNLFANPSMASPVMTQSSPALRNSRTVNPSQANHSHILSLSNNRDSYAPHSEFHHQQGAGRSFSNSGFSFGYNPNSPSNPTNSNNRYSPYGNQFQSPSNSTLIALSPPFNKLFRDEHEKRKREIVDRQKIEKDYRGYRSAIEKIAADKDKSLKKQLKEQQQRNAKNHQLLKINSILSKFETDNSTSILHSDQMKDNSSVFGSPSVNTKTGVGNNAAIDTNSPHLSNVHKRDSSFSISSGYSKKSSRSSTVPYSASPLAHSGSLQNLGHIEAKPVNVINLINSTISAEPEYHKRDFVFRIITEEGGQHIFQAPSEAEMSEWIHKMREAAKEAAAKRLTLFMQDANKRISAGLSSSYESSSASESKGSRSGSFMGFEPNFNSKSSDRSIPKSYQNKKHSLGFNIQNIFDKGSSPNTTSSSSSTRVPSAKNNEILQPKFEFNERKIFGVHLHEIMGENLTPPTILVRCIKEIELRGLTEVGIYRISGSTLEVSRLRKLFDTNPEEVDISFNAFPDINVLSGVLKQFLRELPEPLIPYSLYKGFIAAADIRDHDERSYAIKDLILALPKQNFVTLKALIEHLEKVTDYEEINHMYASNLAIVFGPNLLHPPPGQSNFYNTVTNLGQAQGLVKNMILQYHWLFNAEEDAEAVPGPLSQKRVSDTITQQY
ncbi:hypothetical protein BB560_001150 [Smittium megazygosporum]|uniref:Ras-GEF domain-containing protein n=1 Tax=Smittium megazygosporum TaxID=133381 RepID=A0A2T9ZIL4_9FUNG|nr:hypothetical protein BB560_001150 [Smittium megazygosporum]